MSKTLTVNGTPYSYPTSGDEPGWGESATGWAEEVTDVLDSLLSADDIIRTSFTIANNVTSDTDVVGLNFNTATVRSAVIEYNIYRTSTSTTSGNAESGLMTLVYDNNASSGNKWSLSVGNLAGNAGVTFNITDAGQVQYQSTDIGATGYSGTMIFRSKTLV